MNETPDRRSPGPSTSISAAVLVLVLTGCVVAAGGPPPQQPTGQAAPPAAQAPAPAEPDEPNKVDDPEAFNEVGEAAMYKVCGTACHGDEPIFSTRRSAREWNQLIGDMIGRGAIATPEEEALIREYLPWVWGLVSVNGAPASELAEVIGLSDEDAAAIVAYREANGPFQNIEALLKVPNVDTETIEWQANALRFN